MFDMSLSTTCLFVGELGAFFIIRAFDKSVNKLNALNAKLEVDQVTFESIFTVAKKRFKYLVLLVMSGSGFYCGFWHELFPSMPLGKDMTLEVD